MKNIAVIIFAVLLISLAEAQPICLHPDNPHYFLYNGKPAILITSAEHYGAVINLDWSFSNNDMTGMGLDTLGRQRTGKGVRSSWKFCKGPSRISIL